MRSIKFFLLAFVLFSIGGYAQTVRLPYNDDSGWMLVDLKVNNKPMTFLFDTGWDGLSIRSSLLKEFYVGEAISAVDANNVVQAVPTIYVDSLKVGNYTFRHLPFTDFESFPMINDPIFNCYKIDGILGNVIYKDKVLEIDPIKKEIIIQDFSPELVDTLLKDNFTSVQSYPLEMDTRIVVPVEVGHGAIRPFLLDTGDNGYLTVTADRGLLAYLSGLKFNSYISVGSIGAFGMNESINRTLITQEARIKIGKMALENEELTFSASDDTYQIGVEFIKQFHMYYLPSFKLLYLKKVQNNPIVSTLEKVGYGIAYIEGKYMVAAIHEKEKTVRLGDVVLSIDGQPMEQLCGYRKYLQRSKKQPKLEVLRNGEKLTL
ncbi:aspartyl protease family protein [Myroides sp. N17-2]|uniref:aspartyl protease family protein n=1 Tax=Myroides sp. N17-2 TaxID=2030799 RepID=UPI000EFBC7BA|nr:aspartyl protease family protein [Myroides sp. N17-2]